MSDEGKKPGASDSPSSKGTDTPDSTKPTLSQLLKQWEEGEKPVVKEPAKPDEKAQLAAVLDNLQERDLKEAAKAIRADREGLDSLAYDWLWGQARRNPEITKAFEARFANPAKWDELVKTLGTEFSQVMGDLQPKDDKGEKPKKVAAALRRARESEGVSSGFDSINWGGMSDQDFEIKKREVFAAHAKGQLT